MMWVYIIVGIVVVAGVIWWIMNKKEGSSQGPGAGEGEQPPPQPPQM